MESLIILMLLTLVIGACMYLLLCIDPNHPGFLGILHRFVYSTFPMLLKYLNKNYNIMNRKILGARVFGFFSGIIHYVFYTNHPLVQYFYILVAVGGFLVYCIFGFFRHFGTNPIVSHFDTAIGSIMAFYSFYSYYQACHFSGGIINSKNVKEYIENYKDYYDNIIYIKDNKCKTCNIVKPPRSKHCRVCDMCVSKFDHHCVWIRQCVGQKNYKYFLKFIGMHALLCNFGAFIGLRCLYGITLQKNLFNATFRNPVTKEIIKASYIVIFKYLFYEETMYIFIVLLCIVMGVSLTFFVIYHLFMLRSDNTTNERMKRSDFKEFFSQEITQQEKLLKQETDAEEIKQIEAKLTKFKKLVERLNMENQIGVWGGLKKVFSEPNEIKSRAIREWKKYQ